MAKTGSVKRARAALPAIAMALATATVLAWAETPPVIGPTAGELRSAASRADWLLPNRDYAGSRHSPLTAMGPGNAATLRRVCDLDLDENSRFAAAPIVHAGVLYVTSGDATFAIDAANCRLLWRHDWSGSAGTPGVPRKVTNAFKSGGVALQDGRLVRATSDGRLIALDATSGTHLWDRPIASSARYEFVTMAPLIHEDRVIAGIGIGEFGVRGWIGAFRLADGQPLWRFDTVPADGAPGADTWSEADARARGGGGVWGTPSLDVATGVLYAAVGNPVPDFHGEVREGANLYTDSLLALDARSGDLLWYRQFVPHDLHDWDLTVAGPIYAGSGAGVGRKTIVAGGKDGLLRGLDLETRALRFETAVTTRENTDAPPTAAGVRACPGVLGGMQWSGAAFDPALQQLVVPSVEWCGTYRRAEEPRYIRGQLYLGGSFSFDGVDQGRGWLTAVDAATGAVRWRYASPRPMLAAVTSTASGLVITGELTGHLLVLDGRDGRVLARVDTGSPLHAGIVTYETSGRQYVAVAAGTATGFWRMGGASSRVMVFATGSGD